MVNFHSFCWLKWLNPHVDFLVLQCVCRRSGGQTSLKNGGQIGQIPIFLESNIPAGCLSKPHFNRACFWPFLSSHKNHHFLTVSCEGVRVFSRNFGRPFLPNFCQNHSGRHFFPSFFLHSLFFTLCSSLFVLHKCLIPFVCVACQYVLKCKRTCSSVAWRM